MCFSRTSGFVGSLTSPARRVVTLAGVTFALLPVGSVLAATTNQPVGSVSPSEQARELLVASIGVGPGQALADKAITIQDAVDSNPTNTPVACANITDYLGLVKAQTAKHLNAATAATLSDDASNLAAALGC